MNLLETARTRRADVKCLTISSMPFPQGTSIQTEGSSSRPPQEGTVLRFSPSVEGAREIPLCLKSFLREKYQSGSDMVVFEDQLGTSAQFELNSALRWITAQESTKQEDSATRLVEAARAFYSIGEVGAVGIEDSLGEKSIHVLLNSAERSDELLSRLIDVEETVQGKLDDIYLAFNYIPVPASLANGRGLVSPQTIWIKK